MCYAPCAARENTGLHIMQRVKMPAVHQPEVTQDTKCANYVTPYAYSLIVKQLLL